MTESNRLDAAISDRYLIERELGPACPERVRGAAQPPHVRPESG